MGDTYDLLADEMVALHLRISADIQQESQPFMRLMMNAMGNLLLWPGGLVMMLIAQRLSVNEAAFLPIFSLSLIVAVLSTMFLGLLLPVKVLGAPKAQRDDLHRIYGHKRKRHSSAAQEQLDEDSVHLGDDGELVSESNFETESGEIKMH